MKIQKRHALIAAGIAAVSLAIGLSVRPGPVTVDTAVVDRGPLRVTVDEDGETRVLDRYVVSSPVTGRMVRLECEPGDTVTAGSVLARVFPLPLDTRGRAEAAERLEATEAAHGAALARVEQARALWSDAVRSLERMQRVEAEVPGTFSARRLDEARTAERAAELEVEQATRAAEAVGHEVESARAALLGADGGGEGEPTRVLAPVAGRVLRVYEECERAVTAGAPILEIGDPSELEVVVDVLSDDAARLREGALALITTGSGADTLRGRIERVDPSAFTKLSPLGVEEQRVNVLVGLGDGAVSLGDRYRVEASLVVWEAEDVVRVPVSALFRSEGGWSVFAVEGGRAVVRSVDLGERGRRAAEVRSGLEVGDVVVLYPSGEVEEGVKVVTRQ